ncbi:glycosyltransferase family A protein [Lysinibacillus xylanilyticus]|uniref:glycosyltransferase family A protein n=1 Tax=Lysinibacillus xylanilyticus TaxID=582475 RepID=UPI00381FFC94
MKLQVLVSTMNQTNYDLIEKMNIQSDAIIVNQCDRNEIKQINYKGNNIMFMSFAERGVGLSRNSALMRASADICLMADDDMVYMDGYENIVLDAFKNNPRADMIMFNVPIHYKNGQTKIKILKNDRVHFLNSLKYGTVNIAFKREAIFTKNIYFSLLFGGGAYYGSGEDSLFIKDALRSGLKIYSSTKVIADIMENESTWFTGYNEKYFFDRGALFQAIGGSKLSFLLMIQFLIRKRKLYSDKINSLYAFRQMIKGRQDFLERVKL